ncbi:hypothetical protein ACRRVB_02870 [Candidatus Cardinium hertigii]|uniref:hypothetical protein n=1 Tax=Candidatus Cardinium hertigii TaxID=247481 RepID=UPI003D7D63A4
MAYKNIYEVLEQYEYDPSKMEDFIKEINTFKSDIDIIDPDKRVTPITYYCIKHLKSGVNRDVLEILITELEANVNKKSARFDIPLSILLDSENRIDNVDAIKLLYQYTDKNLLIEQENPGKKRSLFVRLITDNEIFNSEEVDMLHGDIIRTLKLKQDKETWILYLVGPEILFLNKFIEWIFLYNIYGLSGALFFLPKI